MAVSNVLSRTRVSCAVNGHQLAGVVIKCVRLCLLLCFFTLYGLPLQAQYTSEAEQLSRLSGTVANSYQGNSEPLAVNAIVTTVCPTGTWTPARIRNVITLSFIETSTKYLANDFYGEVTVEIKYGPNAGATETHTQTLAVEFIKEAGKKYKAKEAFTFEGAKYVEVKVTAIDIEGIDDNEGLELLLLENQMMITWGYVLNTSATPTELAHTLVTADGLKITTAWPSNTGHNAYQLEWTWLEDELAVNYKDGGPSVILSKLFLNNATRVELSEGQTEYVVPLYYNGTGKLYYRVRPVLVTTLGTQEGQWVYGSTPYSYTGHEPSLNWQVTTSFAEDGKRKSVMQYYDGSLRGRQTATKDNTVNKVVLAETLYDEQGRAAIQILPAPTMLNSVAYIENLNLFNGQTPSTDPLNFFDLQPTSPGIFPFPMDSTTGAAKYYSRNNEELTGGSQSDFLPAADGYAYTLTRYTPDATGRIATQSGVGKAFRMGGGHETRYYYGAASQEELDGLFGTEVGDFSHYSKNMVQDANGQMSISYVDMNGRTIATALAGEAPANLIALNNDDNDMYPNQAGTVITRNLLNAGTNVVKGNMIESVTSLLVPVPTSYNFVYKLDTASIQLPTCTSGVRCYDLMYDLQFSIVHESGDSLPIIYRYNNIKLDPDDDCATGAPAFKDENGNPVPGDSIKFSRILGPGSYLVRKTLTLSENSLEHYKEMYLQKALCKTEQEIIDSIYNVLITVTGCDTVVTQSSCEACITALGDSASFRSEYLADVDWASVADTTALNREIALAYREALARCNDLCVQASPFLKMKRQQMLQDMMPFSGQYAGSALPAAGMPTTLYNKYNIFSTNTPATQPFYRKPKNATGTALDYYYNTQGDIDLTIHPTGTMNAYDFLGTLDKNAFNAVFNRNWANSLLPYHPEFPKLRFAEEKLAQSYDWIYRFLNVDTWQAASDSGFIFTNALSITDPFYSKAPAAMKDSMGKWIGTSYLQGLSLWRLAYGDVKCKDIISKPARDNCYTAAPSVPPFSSLTTAEKDQAWRSFRNLYNMARDVQINQLLADSVVNTDANDLASTGYILRFPTSRQQEASQYGWTGYPSTPYTYTEPDTTGLGSDGGLGSSACSSYINNWRQWLLQCDSLAIHPDREAILEEIMEGMVAVCEKGQDATSPYGASNVAPGTPVDGSPRSFEEVINAVFAAHGINRNSICNAYLIEFPKPYGKGRQLIKTAASTLDSCNCDRVDSLKAEAITAGYNPSTMTGFNSFLWATYHDTLTSTLYNAFSKCDSLGGYDIKCRTINDTIFYHCDSTPPVCENWQSFMRASPGDCPPGYFWSEIKQRCMPELIIVPEDSCYITCPITVCDTIWRGNIVLPVPVILPDFLRCGYVNTDQCFSCAELSILTKAFKDTFNTVTNAGPYFPYNTGPIFNNYALSDTQIAHNQLYARFLNYRTGLQLSWAEYAQLADSANCDLGTYLGNIGGGVANLSVSSRSGNTPPEYTATSTVELLPGFESGVNDLFIAYISSGEPANQTVVCIDATAVTDTTGVVTTNPPCERVMNMSIAQGQEIYRIRKEFLLGQLEAAYRDAFAAAKERESFTVKYKNSEYHYTLYYYDQGGNLAKTVPPKGVNPDFREPWLAEVKEARENDEFLPRPHSLVTEYRYNSLNQVVQQKSPDGGLSKFWYDKLGRLVVSQNAQQALEDRYSYTRYDLLGRIVEVGQKTQTTAMTQVISQDPEDLETWITTTTGGGGIREQLTVTGYDLPYGYELYPEGVMGHEGYMNQRNLRNRVSYSMVKDNATDAGPASATFYTYDIMGNVDTLLQNYAGLAALGASEADQHKLIAYKYDLISGKVNGVDYQPGQQDAFYHRYYYDAENRLTSVLTSRDSVIWERDARYEYYRHGPLARSVTGQLQVQGLDYAYTLQGWIKGLNSTSVSDGAFDPGQDGYAAGSPVARDVLGYGLHYYNETGLPDYRAIGEGVAPFAAPNNADFRSLYNGNVAGMSVNLAALGRASAGVNAEPLFYKYRYDQLNRLVSMRAYKGFDNSTNAWTPVLLDDYREEVRYDPNGNILNYIRNGSPEVPDSAKLMDSLTYKYWANTNQLKQVLDDAGYSGNYWADIDNQTETENYIYDAIGNLVQDKAENLTIAWNVYGKIKTITKSGGNTITYTYDAAGNRISKLYNDELTVYVRDASGNVMNVYVGAPATTWSLSETHLYGSSRLGLIDGPGIAPETGITLEGGYEPATLYSFERGRKIFDLSNHLGNVLATVKDRTLAVDDGNGEVTYYEGDVVTANDYYPFGMLMPGRTYGALGRYGFNGKEQDSEIKGMGMQYDYGFRIYDPRVGRFLSVDPLFQSYPWYTPYQFAGNMPIWAIDLDGLEELKTTKKIKIFAITANGRTMKEGETFIDPFGGTPVVRVVGTTVVQEGDPGGPLEIKSIYVNLLTGREEYLEYSTTPKAPVHPQKIPDPEPNTKNNTSQTNEVETDPLQPGSVGTKAPDVISWREGVEHVYTDNFIQLPKTYSIDIRFELKRANFLSDAAAAKSMNDFTSQLQKDGIREINYTLSVAAGSGDASTDYYKNVRELALARATKINSMLAAKGIKGSAQINYVGGDSPTITAEAINPVMQNIRVGYRETVYKIRQKLVNGKPTGAVKRSGQIGASKSSLSPNSSTPQNKTEWNR